MKEQTTPTLVDILFPPRCIICRKLTPLHVFICPECARELSYTGTNADQHGDFFDVCYSPFYYEEPLRTSFLRYKFNGRRQFARHFGRWMADCLVAQDEGSFDLITWAPLNWRRRLKRGYDQAELLAREISSHTSVPVVSTLQKAHRAPLSGLEGNKAVRNAHVMGAYTLRKGVDVTDKRILLVDDVITSGATMSECARILKTAGADQVIGLTLLRKRGD